MPVLPDVKCSACSLEWPEFDQETARLCPECGGWFDHVPTRLRIDGHTAAKTLMCTRKAMSTPGQDVDPQGSTPQEFSGEDNQVQRHILVVNGDGLRAAAILEAAGIDVEQVTTAPGDAPWKASSKWKSIAIWLADVHAATSSHLGGISRTGKAERARLHTICEQTLQLLRSDRCVNLRNLPPMETVEKRLLSAYEATAPKKTERQ